MGKVMARLNHKAQAVRRLLADHGVGWVASFLLFRFVLRRLLPSFQARARRKIEAWLTEGDGPVHIYVSPLDWDYPYQQRPQHLARGLVARGRRVIFVTPTIGYDRILDARVESSRLLLTPHRDATIDLCEHPIVHALSTDASLNDEFVKRISARGGRVAYDYIDALDDAVSSGTLTPERRALHAGLLANEDDAVVVVTADALLREVEAVRMDGYALITNGVETTAFSAACRGRHGLRADFARVVDRGLPVAGYFGSFAGWFDYDLMNGLARSRPSYSIVALGPDLDGSRGRLDATLDNLFVLPAMSYPDIARHAAWFDVGLVPFLINEITCATSPLKIFEYMALGKPTVSTDMPECRKYVSVLTASTPAAFLVAVDRAMMLGRTPAFERRARAEAAANDWAEKVDALLALVDRPQSKSDRGARRLLQSPTTANSGSAARRSDAA